MSVFVLLLLVIATGCASAPKPRFASRDDAAAASPLGPSYLLLPLPNEEDTLLGRILPTLPEPGRALEEVAKPNPCAEHLAAVQMTPLASTFEDAEELSGGGSARAMLGTFGFQGDVEVATHFVYKLSTHKRVSRADTIEYEACCKEKGCGYGYVSALIYGEGHYATGEESSASVRADYAFAGINGATRLKTLHQRSVKGFIAAVVRVTDPTHAQNMTPLGVMKDLKITEETLPELVKREYERDKITVHTTGANYVLKDGLGNEVTENAFVRRFQETTGSDDLGDVETRRNMSGVLIAATPVAAGAGLVVYGLISLPWLRPAQGAICGELGCSATIFGAGIAAAGAPFLAWQLLSESRFDGAADDHHLTELDARILVTQHNRALLRKTIRAVQRGRSRMSRSAPAPGPTARPMLGVGYIGLQGSF